MPEWKYIILQKRRYVAQILLSILGVINTNAVILLGFYENKIWLLFYSLVLKHKAHYLYLVSYYVYLI
jgi:hypothetical protein